MSDVASRRRAFSCLLATTVVVPVLTSALGSRDLLWESVAAACTGMPSSNLVPPAASAGGASAKPVEVPSNAHLFAIGGTGMFDSVPYPEAPTLERDGQLVATKARLVGVAAAEVVPSMPFEVGALYTFKVFSSLSTFKVRAGVDTTPPRFSVKGQVVVHAPARAVPRSSCDPGTSLSLEVDLVDDSPAMLFVWVGDAAHPPKLDQAPDSAAITEARDGKSTIRFRPSRSCPECKGAPVVGLLAMDVAGNLSEEAWVFPKKKLPASETFLGKSLPAFAVQPRAGSEASVEPSVTDASVAPPSDASGIDGGSELRADASDKAESPQRLPAPPRGCGGCSAISGEPVGAGSSGLGLVATLTLVGAVRLRRRSSAWR